jgi:hypothetical protein
MLGGTGDPEEVRLRAGREHEHIAGELLAAGERDRPTLRVHRGNRGSSNVHIGVCGEDVGQVEPYVGRRELGRGDLVEQGQELVPSLAVQQSHLYALPTREPLGRRDTREPTAHHNNPSGFGTHHRRGPPQPDGDFWGNRCRPAPRMWPNPGSVHLTQPGPVADGAMGTGVIRAAAEPLAAAAISPGADDAPSRWVRIA